MRPYFRTTAFRLSPHALASISAFDRFTFYQPVLAFATPTRTSMLYPGSMATVSIQDASTHFAQYLEAAEKGETITLMRDSKPVAELRPVAPPSTPLLAPQFGLYAGFGLADSFFEELPESLIGPLQG